MDGEGEVSPQSRGSGECEVKVEGEVKLEKWVQGSGKRFLLV